MPSITALPYPLFKKLDIFSINTRRRVNSMYSGTRSSSKKGHGIEFADYREYQPGDNIKYIDWNLYARSDRTYVKTFQEEQSLEVLLIVDGSKSMFSADPQKWSYVRDLALALSYVAFSEREKVTLKIIGAPKAGPFANIKSIRKLADCFKHEAVNSTGSDFESIVRTEVIKTLEQAKYPSICIFISDFFYDQEIIAKTFKMLAARNLDLVAIQVIGKKDLQPFGKDGDYQAVDAETGQEHLLSFDKKSEAEYSALLGAHCSTTEKAVKQAKANYALANASEDLFEFLSINLTKIGLLS